MSARKTHIWREEPKISSDGSVTLDTIIESPLLGNSKLWFKIPGEFSLLVTTSCDPLLVANLFLLMQEGADCIVHGQVSPSLLKNITEFQAAWACWRPGKYRQVEIIADEEAEGAEAQEPELAICAFTGGADSCYTMFSHKTGTCSKRWRRNIEAGLMVHGYDIPLEQEAAFERAASVARKTLSSLDVKLITMSTNLLALNPEWEDTHIAGIASCLMLFQHRYGEGLIASGPDYGALAIPWGSSPITDHLLSSNAFKIVHDAAGVTRIQKFKAIAKWHEGFSNLRVCFSAKDRDQNCGVCTKCAFAIMALQNHGLSVPTSFPQPLDATLINLDVTSAQDVEGYKKLIVSARKANLTEQWVNVLSQRIDDREKSPLSRIS